MNLKELKFNRLTRGCIVKLERQTDVECPLDDLHCRYQEPGKPSKRERVLPVEFTLVPGYYEIIEACLNVVHPFVRLDFDAGKSYKYPTIDIEFLTLDAICDEYNEKAIKRYQSEKRNISLIHIGDVIARAIRGAKAPGDEAIRNYYDVINDYFWR